ncbi:four helix bundle protein [Pontibacter sp. HSC-36F09]|uniref:four helix bundle protein n=1 Tax=Pontibacter sp. HSC-36F09 TaxID=2910966 RepID=UPI00353229F1
MGSCDKLEPFPQNTVGHQYTTAADSISANIAEGFGRYGKKDKIKYYRYAQGSMYESFNWTEQARVRKLITEEQYLYILGELKKLPIAINSLIKWTNNNLTI